MTENPLVSIIIAAYNEERYLEECIESCLKQTYPNIEICITDDGSTDSTWDILKRYECLDNIIIYRFNNNKGKVAAMNNSFNLSSGEYIAIMGADDIALPNRILDSINNIKNYGLIFGNLIKFDENGVLSNNLMKDSFGFIGDREIGFNDLIYRPVVFGGTIFAAKKVLNSVFPLDVSLTHEDWWIPLVVSFKSKILFIDRVFIKYRIHNKQTSGNNKQNKPNYKRWRYLIGREEAYYERILSEFKLDKKQGKYIYKKFYICRLFNSNNFLLRLNIYKLLITKYNCSYREKIRFAIPTIHICLYFFIQYFRSLVNVFFKRVKALCLEKYKEEVHYE